MLDPTNPLILVTMVTGLGTMFVFMAGVYTYLDMAEFEKNPATRNDYDDWKIMKNCFKISLLLFTLCAISVTLQ